MSICTRLLGAMMLVVLATLNAFSVSAGKEVSPEDLKTYPVNSELIVKFLDKYGFQQHQSSTGEKEEIVSFKVTDKASGQSVDFFVVIFPEGKIMKIECPVVASVPSNPGKVSSLLSKLNELNGLRTIGKYCTDRDLKRVRFFHYRVVVGGLSYVDFVETLTMMQFIIFEDLKALREATS
ncbi:MAG: YbjN domain-containing protein [Thermodesulfobacteriota bacterium]